MLLRCLALEFVMLRYLNAMLCRLTRLEIVHSQNSTSRTGTYPCSRRLWAERLRKIAFPKRQSYVWRFSHFAATPPAFRILPLYIHIFIPLRSFKTLSHGVQRVYSNIEALQLSNESILHLFPLPGLHHAIPMYLGD